MTLALRSLRVDISLCGGVPRSRQASTTSTGRPKASVDTSASLRDECSRTLSRNASPTPPKVVVSDQGVDGPKSGITLSPVQASHNLIDSSLSLTKNDDMLTSGSTRHVTPIMIEPPKWAVPAKGKSRLEPVCDAIGSHPNVDLTQRPFIRVGRSPTSDLQLLHCTSSRRHALLFHHSNGSCYIVDCGSVHGTYINGVRIPSHLTSNTQRVVPHRVRRGSLVRFGGEGAPAFVLKTHAIGFSHLIPDMNSPSEQPTLSPKPTLMLQKQLMHRLHALTPYNRTPGGILKKRSFDSEEMCEPPAKRARCLSPSETEPSSMGMRLVSPDAGSKRVTFADEPALAATVTYTTSASEESEGDEEDL